MQMPATTTGAKAKEYRKIEVLPLPDAAGAEVRCGNIDSIDDATFREIHQAWLEHLVLLFGDQQITDAGLIAFSKQFGPLKRAAVGTVDQDSDDPRRYPDIHVVSNVKENGLPIGILGDGEVVWHTDMSSFLQPPTATMLYALDVPANGGDTFFGNMYLAYDTLPQDIKQRLVGLTLKHQVLNNSAEPGTGASHPSVCTHPETGCNALYLGTRSNTYVNELRREESNELLAVLWAHATQPHFAWRHHWRQGDLVVWDNRCLMHCREAFDPNSRRILHRTQVDGSVKPYTAPDALERPPHPRGQMGRNTGD